MAEEVLYLYLTGLMDLEASLKLNSVRKFSKRPKELDGWLRKELLWVGLDTRIITFQGFLLRFDRFQSSLLRVDAGMHRSHYGDEAETLESSG